MECIKEYLTKRMVLYCQIDSDSRCFFSSVELLWTNVLVVYVP
jgi:hypothetical protein